GLAFATTAAMAVLTHAIAGTHLAGGQTVARKAAAVIFAGRSRAAEIAVLAAGDTEAVAGGRPAADQRRPARGGAHTTVFARAATVGGQWGRVRCDSRGVGRLCGVRAGRAATSASRARRNGGAARPARAAARPGRGRGATRAGAVHGGRLAASERRP